MKEPNKAILDYEQSIESKIVANSMRQDFPQLEDYNIAKSSLNEYLFEKQAILDSFGSPKAQYTVYGILMVLPVIFMSALSSDQIPGGDSISLLLGIAIGGVLAVAAYFINKIVVKAKLSKLYDTDIERYLDAVEKY